MILKSRASGAQGRVNGAHVRLSGSHSRLSKDQSCSIGAQSRLFFRNYPNQMEDPDSHFFDILDKLVVKLLTIYKESRSPSPRPAAPSVATFFPYALSCADSFNSARHDLRSACDTRIVCEARL